MGLSIQDLGAIGKFIGAFGVMALLIYVGQQIKQTRNVVMGDSEASFAFLMQSHSQMLKYKETNAGGTR